MEKEYVGQGNQQSVGLGGRVTRETAATEVVQYAEQTMARAAQLAEMTDRTLHTVCMDFMQAEICDANKKTQREYPPLFAQLREYLDGINRSMDGVENTLSRVEL